MQTMGVAQLLWWQGYWVDSRGIKGFDTWQGKEIFLLRVETGRGGPLSPLFSGYRLVLSTGINLPGRETNHSSPCSAKVTNEWSYTTTSPYTFLACTGKTLLLLNVTSACKPDTLENLHLSIWNFWSFTFLELSKENNPLTIHTFWLHPKLVLRISN
jgi:hypothetical protein